MQCAGRVSACRREPNSHEAAQSPIGCGPAPPRGTVDPRGEIGRHKDSRLLVGTTLPQVTKAMTGNRRATSLHRNAALRGGHRLQSARWVESGTGAPANTQGSGRPECAPRHRLQRGAARHRSEHKKLRSYRKFRLWHAGRGLTLRSRRGPTALHLARAAPVVHDAPRGQGTIPSVPPHLKR